jgi:hypothetical protein
MELTTDELRLYVLKGKHHVKYRFQRKRERERMDKKL